MITRVVVADERGVSFLDADGPRQPLQLRTTVANEAAGLRDRDLETDRAGRGSNSGGWGRHGLDGERSTRRHLLETFARNVASLIDDARKRSEFHKLVIVAGPRMLGLIRDGLSVPCRSLVVAEVGKDLSHQDVAAIRDAVPHAAFSRLS